MNNLEEAIRTQQKEVHVHALDLLKHVLKGDPEAVMYTNKPGEYEIKLLNKFTKAMEQRAEVGEFEDIVEECYQPKKAWKTRFQESDGDFAIDRYLENDARMFETEYKTLKPDDGLTLIMAIDVPYGDRDKSYMQERHKECYTKTVEALSIGRPARVVAIDAFSIPEGTTRFFLTIKDWNDPIFPGIWGALKDNKSANDFTNIVADFVIGTEDEGNGSPTYTNVADYFEENEYQLVGDSRYLR